MLKLPSETAPHDDFEVKQFPSAASRRSRRSAGSPFPASRKPVAHTSRAVCETRTKARVAEHLRQRIGHGADIAGRDQQARRLVGRADELGDRPCRRADDRQAVRQGFGDHHAVRFVQRRQDEQIHAVVARGQCGGIEQGTRTFPETTWLSRLSL